MDGKPHQFFWYSPWGEPLVDQHFGTGLFSSRYLFNAKELDTETGLYYYGARYSNPVFSHWISVDPKAHLLPSWSPYVISFNNPVNVVDPDGEYPIYITTRSYAPFKEFGPFFARYHGDDRGHSLDRGASYRTSATIK